MIDKITI